MPQVINFTVGAGGKCPSLTVLRRIQNNVVDIFALTVKFAGNDLGSCMMLACSLAHPVSSVGLLGNRYRAERLWAGELCSHTRASVSPWLWAAQRRCKCQAPRSSAGCGETALVAPGQGSEDESKGWGHWKSKAHKGM